MPKNRPQTTKVTYDEIASRAYQRYLERGSADGFDMEDWLAAEQELARERGEPQPARPSKISKPAAA